MRIAIDARMLADTLTGVGRYLLNLIKHLAEIDKKNDYLILAVSRLSPDHFLNKFQAPNFEKIIVKTPIVSLRQHFTIPPILRREKIDIFHYPQFDLPFFQRRKSVITIYDLNVLQIADYFPKQRFIRRTYSRWITKISLQKAEKVIAISQSTKGDIIRYFKTPEEKIEVIYGAVDEHFHPLPQKETRKKLEKYSLSSPYLLYVGVHRAHKNLLRLLEAYRLLKENGRITHKLVIVGEKDPRFLQAKWKVEKLGLDGEVIFTGYLPEEDLPYFYNGATLFIFPSLYEGFGMPVLEAMACGTPVVCSHTSSLPEIAGEAAIFVDPHNIEAMAEGMKKVIDDGGLRKRLSLAGLEQAKRFSWHRTAQKTLEVYRSLQE